MSRFSSSDWSGGYQCKYVMNLIQAFPVCVLDVDEALSVVCEGLGNAPEITTSLSGILGKFDGDGRLVEPRVVVSRLRSSRIEKQF